MTDGFRVLVAGLGYQHLRDHSVGVAVIEALQAREWPEGVSVEDVSYGPIAFVQRLEDQTPGERFTRVVFVAGVHRGGMEPGRVTAYRWDGALPSEEHIQLAVTEAVTGVISLDNTVVIAGHFGQLPGDVVIVEVEPEAHEFGDTFTPAVQEAFGRACEVVTLMAIDPDAWRRLPRLPLGGGRAPLLRVGAPLLGTIR